MVGQLNEQEEIDQDLSGYTRNDESSVQTL